MLIMILVTLVSFIPSLLMFLFLRNNRKDDETYRKDCNELLFKGVLICGLVMLFGAMLRIPWNILGIAKDNKLLDRAFVCYVVNALCEEMAKFLYARKYIVKDKTKTSRLDIISYLVISAISFALLEDIVYAFSTSIGQIIVRGVLMGHVPEQLLMGELYGRSIAEKKPGLKVLAFLLPILIHGSYNFLLTDGLPEWAAFVVVTLVIVETVFMICMIFRIKKKRNDPAYTEPVYMK